MQPAPVPDVTAPPGTSGYLPGLFSRARAAHPDLPLDPVILQSLLICLIAQPRPSGSAKLERSPGSHSALHLILRTKEEDVGLVVNLVALTLQHVLGIPNHKQKIPAKTLPQSGGRRRLRPKHLPSSSGVGGQTDRPDAFLRSLFFRRAPHSSFSSHRSSTPRPRSGVIGDNTPRLAPIPLTSPAKSSRSTANHAPHRSASFPTAGTDGEEEDKYFDGASLASSRRPLLTNRTPGSTVRSNASKGRPGSHRHRTDPLPLCSLFSPPGAEDIAEADESTAASATTDSLRAQKSVPDSERTGVSGGIAAVLPRAVVVSGLEHTTAPSQRALMRVLTERRIVFDGYENDDTDLSGRDPDVEDGTWNLPDGFLMVYVCKWDPHERPAILRGLIDKFSMSADIFLPPSVRQSYAAYRATHTPTPRGTPVPSSLALPHPVHPYFAAPTPVHPSPARRSVPLPAPTPQAQPVLQITELSHLRSLARPYPVAAPIFYPSVNATEEYPYPSGNSHPDLPAEPTPHVALHPSLEHYLLDLFAATRHHPALDGTLLTVRAHADAEALARAFRVLNGDSVGTTLVEHEARIREHDGETAVQRVRDSSADWRSEESVVGNGYGYRYGYGKGKGTGSDEFSIGGGVRVRVEAEDGDVDDLASPGLYDALLAQTAVAMSELSPAEAEAAAMRRGWPEVWDVSEEDVARIFPRVVSHRVRVRDGPADELLGSVMFPAVPPEVGVAGAGSSPGTGTDVGQGVRLGWERKSVKEILVRILAEV